MENITVQISSQELSEMIKAYNTLKVFLDKTASSTDQYHYEFLKNMKEIQAKNDDTKQKTVKKIPVFSLKGRFDNINIREKAYE